jgi:hypothetical protein
VCGVPIVCGGSSVFGGYATRNDAHVYVYGPRSGLSAHGVMSPSRGGVTLAPHVACYSLAVIDALTSPYNQKCS